MFAGVAIAVYVLSAAYVTGFAVWELIKSINFAEAGKAMAKRLSAETEAETRMTENPLRTPSISQDGGAMSTPKLMGTPPSCCPHGKSCRPHTHHNRLEAPAVGGRPPPDAVPTLAHTDTVARQHIRA